MSIVCGFSFLLLFGWIASPRFFWVFGFGGWFWVLCFFFVFFFFGVFFFFSGVWLLLCFFCGVFSFFLVLVRWVIFFVWVFFFLLFFLGCVCFGSPHNRGQAPALTTRAIPVKSFLLLKGKLITLLSAHNLRLQPFPGFVRRSLALESRLYPSSLPQQLVFLDPS